MHRNAYEYDFIYDWNQVKKGTSKVTEEKKEKPISRRQSAEKPARIGAGGFAHQTANQ